MPSTPAIILLSGGLDSATVLALARSRGHPCLALTFDYGQRHRHELTAAAAVARVLGASEHRTIVLDPRAFAGSALTRAVSPAFDNSPARADAPGVEPPTGVGGRGDPGQVATPDAPSHDHKGSRTHGVSGPSTSVDGSTPVSSATTGVPSVPKGREEGAMSAEIPVTYVPARNLVFLSIAVATAESIGSRDIFIGVNAVDFSGYPDCRPAFIAAMQHAARLGTKAGVDAARAGRDEPALTIHTPLIDMTKAQIIRLGASLGVDFALTTSCYDPQGANGSPRACGACDACVLRRRGFEQAGIADPTIYARPPGGGAHAR